MLSYMTCLIKMLSVIKSIFSPKDGERAACCVPLMHSYFGLMRTGFFLFRSIGAAHIKIKNGPYEANMSNQGRR